ncbi:MAG: RIP metalloprotease RseP [Candidatus Marinimicrobia bacterium]|nr:RIP metalloprotease RseP [Candidatus Neomarinimicrobiota bacterium]
MTTLYAFIILLGVLVTIHEFGHFIAARSVGVRVERFSIGVPPRLFTLTSIDNGFLLNIFFFKRLNGRLKWQPIISKVFSYPNRLGSNTEYIIALLPLGGYVKMAGMIDESMDTNLNHDEDEFMSKNLWEKIWILSAGVLMNTLLAIIIFSLLGYYNGIPETKDEPTVFEIQKNMPAEKAGIRPGDRILEIDTKPIDSWESLTKVIHAQPNTRLNFKIQRGSEKLDLVIKTSEYAVPIKNTIDTIGIIGIAPEVYFKDISISDAFVLGIERTISSFGLIVYSLRMLGSGAASISDLGGPIMIAQLAGQTAEAGLTPFLTFMALLSVNLAFLNILPIPGLDGGHIFLHLIEGIIRKPLALKTRIMIQQVGMALLFMLMATVILQDITRLFN